MSKKSKNIGIFGGSFNPPHRGHLAVIRDLLQRQVFDELWLVPVYKHPFGKDLAPFTGRVKMLELLIAALQNQTLHICTAERNLDRVPTYTYDLIRHLKSGYPDHRFTIIVGSDAKAELNKWYRIEDLKKEADFHFLPRQGYEHSPYPQVSSSEIREKIKQGKDVAGLTTESVVDYLRERELYR